MDASFPIPGRLAEYRDWSESGAGRFHWPFTDVELCLIDAWEEWLTHLDEARHDFDIDASFAEAGGSS
jgi:hypothetical protein